MAMSIIPFIGTICFCVQVAYPLYASIQATCRKGGAVVSELSQWLVYWVIYTLFSFLESTLLFFLVDWVPLYLELKVLFFLWLVYPEFQGAAWLWYSFLEGPFRKADEIVMEFVDSKMQMLVRFALGEHEKATKFSQARASDKVE